MPLLEAGRTRIHTRREHRRLIASAAAVILLGVVGFWGALWLTCWFQGEPLPELHTQPVVEGGGLLRGGHLQPPVYLVYGDINVAVVGIVTTAVLFGSVVLFGRRTNRQVDPRERHLAKPKEIRGDYSAHAARKAGAYTHPDSTWWQRRLMPASAFGMPLGEAKTPKAGRLWICAEYCTRIVARPNWGKTFRLLIPMIRGHVGPAVVSSVEPDIFLSTVMARRYRWPDGRRRWLPRKVRAFTGTQWRRPQPEEYPVWVVECLPRSNRVAPDWCHRVRWDLIAGCERYATALRRARALVKGLDEGKDNQDGGTARWFEGVCADVIAAWLHALAFSRNLGVAEMDKWLRTGDIATPRGILDSNRADPEAGAALLEHSEAMVNPATMTNLTRHLSKEGGRTTANVYTFLARAIQALNGEEGREFIADRGEPGQFDPADVIRDKGTLYLLAEDEQMATVRPLLSLLGAEVARAGEQIARQRGGDLDPDREVVDEDDDPPAQRLPDPLALFLDELRRGIRLAELPRIRQTSRKFGITYAYACTNGGDEKALYGEEDADALESGAVTLVGGYDKQAAPEVEKVSGQRAVVTAVWTKDGRSEHEEMRAVIDSADLQKLPAGDAVVVAPGMSPFIVHCRSIYEQRGLRRRIAREKQQVRRG